jgi:hypothetical protein
MKTSIIVTALIALGVIIGATLSALLIMILGNVIISHYDGRPLDYWTSLAIAGLFMFVLGSFSTALNNK